MKKIAVLYSGEIRTLLESFENQYNTIYENNKDFQIDVFAHFWSNDNDLNKKVEDLLSPVKIIFEKQKRFSKSYYSYSGEFPEGKELAMSMFYGINEVNLLRILYERDNSFTYDYVIRMRSDITFEKPIENMLAYSSDTVYAPRAGYLIEDYAVNDQFAIGSSVNMTKFLNIFNNLDILYAMGCTVNPECFLGFSATELYGLNINKEHSFYLKFPYKNVPPIST